MIKINQGKVIIIPDWHQRISFVEAILEKEKSFDNLVFLGDEFDCFEPIDNVLHFSMEECCKWINTRMEEWGDKAIWLLGNHTLAYLASYTPTHTPPKGSFYSCSGWTKNKAKTFNRHINTAWFKKLQLCCKVGNYYCVHAGFQQRQFKPFMSEEDNIQDMYDQWENDKLSFMHSPWHWINYIGPARYGMDDYSSPIWVDFDNEFVPLDSVEQIVGHTNMITNQIRCRKNAIGLENYCIDNNKSMYTVWEDGKLRFGRIDDF